jgi:hypothetical protein
MPQHDRPADARADTRANVEAEAIPPHALAAIVEILNRVYGEPQAEGMP